MTDYITARLTRLLGRLPIGWLQLTHNRMRLAAAIAGVAFANILVLMQLGFMSGLIESIRLPYTALDADIMISGADINTLTDGSPLPRQRMYEALSVPGVASATPLYLGNMEWRQTDGTVRGLIVFGIDPQATAFRLEAVRDSSATLALADHALIDEATRSVTGGIIEKIRAGETHDFEARGRTLTIAGLFTIGGGFTTEGYMVISDSTYFNLFPQRAPGAPDHVLVKLQPGADPIAVRDALRERLPAYDSLVQTIEEAGDRDEAFITTQRPVGIIFGFGIVIGIIVGIIIVYQVLSTDVADHIKEYATFKAIGYPQSFFLSIVLEEAVILAIAGFIPGIITSLLLYEAVVQTANLPMAMTFERAVFVFFGTIAMCVLSGAIATRRLAKADPADLF